MITKIVPRQDGYALVLKAKLVPRKYEPHVARCGGTSGGLGRGGHTRDFFSKVRVVGESPGACWEWIGYRDRDGYGKLTTMIGGRARTVRPHRFLYEKERGPIPAGLYLLHECDNAACVNPWHLRPGTQSENIRACYARGRHEKQGDNRGEMSARTKLRNDDVYFIRSQRAQRGLTPVLAQLFDVKPQVIGCIRRRRTWKHLGNGNKANAMPLAQLRALVEQRRVSEDLDDAATSRPGAE